MKRVSDQAEVAIDFPEKFYMGSFSKTSRFDVMPEGGGIGLKIVKESAPKRTFEMHLHHNLLTDILREWATTIRGGAEISEHDRNDLIGALNDVAAAMAETGSNPG
jgi:hypothetical protein